MNLSDILKPDDFSLVLRLRKKLDEYYKRLEKYPPKSDEWYDTHCKITILRDLLEYGHISFEQISQKLLEQDADTPQHIIYNAYMVMRVYTGDEQNAYTGGGTGLPK